MGKTKIANSIRIHYNNIKKLNYLYKMNNEGISFVIPAFNEGESVPIAIRELLDFLHSSSYPWEIILVDDGSDESSRLIWERAAVDMGIRLIHHDFNRGYGAAIKSGIHAAQYPWIAITDADGSYPVASFAELLARRAHAEMVIGSRQGKIRAIPWLRRPAKWLINRFASYVARRKIPDVNSGMRIFRREWA
jgi:glycosyltransferase involved in cell wall biosynthesis